MGRVFCTEDCKTEWVQYHTCKNEDCPVQGILIKENEVEVDDDGKSYHRACAPDQPLPALENMHSGNFHCMNIDYDRNEYPRGLSERKRRNHMAGDLEPSSTTESRRLSFARLTERLQVQE